MERSCGVCRLDIAPAIDASEGLENEGYFAGNLDTCRVWRKRLTHSVPYVSQQRGLPPNLALNEDTEDGGRDT